MPEVTQLTIQLDPLSLSVVRSFKGKAVIDEKALSRVLGLSRMTVFQLRKSGLLGHYKEGSRVLYGPHHIIEYLQKREIPATADY